MTDKSEPESLTPAGAKSKCAASILGNHDELGKQEAITPGMSVGSSRLFFYYFYPSSVLYLYTVNPFSISVSVGSSLLFFYYLFSSFVLYLYTVITFSISVGSSCLSFYYLLVFCHSIYCKTFLYFCLCDLLASSTSFVCSSFIWIL